MNESPLLIIGAENIAKVLGLSPAVVRSTLLGRPDFPAKKETRRWVSTRHLLSDWADGLVKPSAAK